MFSDPFSGDYNVEVTSPPGNTAASLLLDNSPVIGEVSDMGFLHDFEATSLAASRYLVRELLKNGVEKGVRLDCP